MTPIAVAREVRLYVAEDGRCPYKEWLEALRDIRVQARIGQRLDRLATGNPGDVKPLGEGLAELRITATLPASGWQSCLTTTTPAANTPATWPGNSTGWPRW